MCAIGIGGGADGDFGTRIRRRKLKRPPSKPPSNHNEEDNDLPFEESLGKKDFVSDAPFDGPSTGAAIGIGGGTGGFLGKRGNRRPLRDVGVLAARDRGLKWLKGRQKKDGSWEGRRLKTGLALLAYLGAGQTHKHGSFRKTLKYGLRHLKSIQAEDGCFADRTKAGWLAEHAILTLVMVESFGMTGSPLFKQSSQRGLDLLANTTSPDSAATAWWTLAFHAAKESGLKLPDGWKTASLEALAEVTPGFLPSTDGATSAAVAFARVVAGANPKENAPLSSGWFIDPVHFHFEWLAQFQRGGEDWVQRSKSVLKVVANAQLKDFGSLSGSWSPTGPDATLLGRVGTTALACLTLTTATRYARIIRSR